MRTIMRRVATGVAATGWVVALGVAVAPEAHGATAEQHCVVHVTGQDPETGELHLGPETCADTRTTALRHAGVDLSTAAATDWPIGVHFDGFAYTGSSLTVVGADCTGGWLNLPTAWNNRVSSTMHGCQRIRHFDGANLVSPEETTLYPGANLGSLNNKATSIQYLP